MSLGSRFSLLFEPVKIGPVTAPNRFYQVPHCTGMGYTHPKTLAAMREVKAEGGWGVVNTEYCSIHPSSDDLPAPVCSLWDEGDVKNMALMTDAVHRHGALAGIELWHGGQRSSNNHSRLPALGPNSMPVAAAPWQSQKMDREDIKFYRGWHAAAVRRALQAGFNIVYVYAAHTYLLAQFLDPRVNRREDEHGGSVENRTRIYREIISETRDILADKAALATRIEVLDEDGSGQDQRSALLSQVSPYVDLFDVTIPDCYHEMGVSRFIKEASLENYVAHVKKVTGKPVVSVGRTVPKRCCRKRSAVSWISSAPPGPRLQIPFCRTKSGKDASKTFANASVATSATPTMASACQSAARRTRPWVRNGVAGGTRKRSASPSGKNKSSSLEEDLRALKQL